MKESDTLFDILWMDYILGGKKTWSGKPTWLWQNVIDFICKIGNKYFHIFFLLLGITLISRTKSINIHYLFSHMNINFFSVWYTCKPYLHQLGPRYNRSFITLDRAVYGIVISLYRDIPYYRQLESQYEYTVSSSAWTAVYRIFISLSRGIPLRESVPSYRNTRPSSRAPASFAIHFFLASVYLSVCFIFFHLFLSPSLSLSLSLSLSRPTPP